MNKTKRNLVGFSATAVASIVGISSAFAQTNTPPISAPVTTVPGILQVFCTLIGYFFWFVLAISVIMIIVAAFDYVTAGDNTEKTTRGRKRLTYAAIGILVALLAFVFPSIISSLFTGSSLVTISTSTCLTH